MSSYKAWSLQDLIGGEGKVIRRLDDEALIEWNDGSQSWVYYSNQHGWCFPENNVMYNAQYSSAAGYPD